MNVLDIFANFRQASSSVKEQGTLFEQFTREWLRIDPRFHEIENVYLWNDWDKRGSTADIGIDLVAETRSGETYAIQCKFYLPEHSVPKEEIDSFLATSGKSFGGVSFSRLLLVTTAPLTQNAQTAIEEYHVPVTLQRADMLDGSAIDWDKFWKGFEQNGRVDETSLKPKKEPRPHQREAIDAVRAGFEKSDRGKLIMACGTGKTFTSLQIAETVAPNGGLVLYLVPSLTLMAQTLSEWSRDARRSFASIVVCSDTEVHKRDSRRVETFKKSKKNSQETEPDETSFDPAQLTSPATTDPTQVAKRWNKIKGVVAQNDGAFTVVFSTYQSIQVVSDAQACGLDEFDLVICDEAHRTTGVSLSGADESAFVKVHDNDVIRAKKRLYMTATPRVYGDVAQLKAKEANAELCSMDDEAIYGPVFFQLSFGKAVQLGLLADYKVAILAVDEAYARKYMTVGNSVEEIAATGELMKDSAFELTNVDDVAKMIGCWRGLSKHGSTFADLGVSSDDFASDPEPMKRAVAFCRSIKASKEFVQAFMTLSEKLVADERERREKDAQNQARANLNRQERVDAYLDANDAARKEDEANRVAESSDANANEPRQREPLAIEAEHIDGTFGADAREERLRWLRDEGRPDICRVLSNVRCLSEGVDVPNLDAALFLSPRNSQVDVIQAVGRVMRRAEGKKFGYIILPIVVATDVAPELALDNNERYRVVWQTLQAIRSHDDRFRIMINQLQVGERSENLLVEQIGEDQNAQEDLDALDAQKNDAKNDQPDAVQRLLPGVFHPLEREIFARIVKKCGDRNYLDQWARDVARMTASRVDEIAKRLENPTNAQRLAFDNFLKGLQAEINPNVDKEQAIDMLTQHMTTQPVFDALFADSAFSKYNPVAQQIADVVHAFDLTLTDEERRKEEQFKSDVRAQIEGIRSAQGRQAVVHKLYEQFFAVALPKMAEKLGVVYTPVEVVDYIIHSVDYVLRKEFNRRITNPTAHILDPFTGTGTFIARLLQSGLIEKKDLKRKFNEELHANEIMLMAYYIAAVNIESTFAAVMEEVGNRLSKQYDPFPGLVLTDTFQTSETDPPKEKFVERLVNLLGDTERVSNHKRLDRQRRAPIEVIIGNPPYSVGQKSGNDNNQNEKHPKLDQRVTETYATKSSATLKRSLYDSYVKAFRWASDRIQEKGVVAFVSNGAYIDNASMEGFRKTLVDEFDSIYVFNLRGNQRTQGEMSRKEGGKIFGSGSRTPVAITILVKKPNKKGGATIYYHDIGDYLSREQKLAIISDFGSVEKTPWDTIVPNELGDWINQRHSNFDKLIPLGKRETKDSTSETQCFFESIFLGVCTGRDAWAYHFSKEILSQNMSCTTQFYNSQVTQYQQESSSISVENFACKDGKKISWSRNLLRDLKNGKLFEGQIVENIIPALYRPFCKEHLFSNTMFNDMITIRRKVLPTVNSSNLIICIQGIGGSKTFSSLITNCIPDIQVLTNSRCFPLYYYEPVDASSPLLEENATIVDGYIRRDAITDGIYQECVKRFGAEVTKESIFFYVYGALHSQKYREDYENELKKELARLPLPTSASTFWKYSDLGRELADVHLNYETGKSTLGGRDGKNFKSVEPYPLKVDFFGASGLSDETLYRVQRKMTLGSKKEKQEDGTTRKFFDGTLKYNDYISFRGIPQDAFEYVVNGRSPLEWLVERYYCKEDKASGIVDDPNLWSDDPKYIFDLVPRLVAVSMRTLELLNQPLPDLES